PSWRPMERTRVSVPGTPLAAWSGPAGGAGSLVVYLALPIPDGTAKGLTEGLANRLTNLPGYRVVGRRTETWSGLEAARVDAVAPGMGDRLAASGLGKAVALEGRPLVPTRQVTLGFPRASDTLYLVWHAPESDAGMLEGPSARPSRPPIRSRSMRHPPIEGPDPFRSLMGPRPDRGFEVTEIIH
ncbi:MAG: hypothetical protein WKF75_16475, partial [Singulisphaera sp.]